MTRLQEMHTVAFQGQRGAYSEGAIREAFPDAQPQPHASFEDAFAAVSDGTADRAMIPIENSLAGRVADVHHLLPASHLSIVGEHFSPISHCLLAPHSAARKTITEVHSHIHALGQCRTFLRRHGMQPVVHADTAGAAHDVAQRGDTTVAAIASRHAASVYDLTVLEEGIEDAPHNTTRFLIMAPEAIWPSVDHAHVVTSIVFSLRSVPAALYKAIGGFATAGVNMTKIESYTSGPQFTVAQFYAEVEGHPHEPRMQHAFEELVFYTDSITTLGVYPTHPHRRQGTTG